MQFSFLDLEKCMETSKEKLHVDTRHVSLEYVFIICKSINAGIDAPLP